MDQHGVCKFANLQSHRSNFPALSILVLFVFWCLAKQQEEERISSEKPSRAIKHHAWRAQNTMTAEWMGPNNATEYHMEYHRIINWNWLWHIAHLQQQKRLNSENTRFPTYHLWKYMRIPPTVPTFIKPNVQSSCAVKFIDWSSATKKTKFQFKIQKISKAVIEI